MLSRRYSLARLLVTLQTTLFLLVICSSFNVSRLPSCYVFVPDRSVHAPLPAAVVHVPLPAAVVVRVSALLNNVDDAQLAELAARLPSTVCSPSVLVAVAIA